MAVRNYSLWLEKDGICRPFSFGINGLIGFSEGLRDTAGPLSSIPVGGAIR
jgi:hypothetical protein